MDNIPKSKTYKSPRRKLVRFFEKSRDQWKAKHRRTKTRVKRLENRVRFLEKSKAQWKSRVKELELERSRSQAREHALEKEMEALQKKESTRGSR